MSSYDEEIRDAVEAFLADEFEEEQQQDDFFQDEDNFFANIVDDDLEEQSDVGSVRPSTFGP